jgi:hypothetical protein
MWCREETVEVAGALGKADVCNRMLITLDRELEELFEAGEADAFILYVYGLVLADRYALCLALQCSGQCTSGFLFARQCMHACMHVQKQSQILTFPPVAADITSRIFRASTVGTFATHCK